MLFTFSVAGSGSGSGIQRIAQGGGAPAPVTTLDAAAQENAHYWPEFLPDGRQFLFLARSANREKTGIYVGSLDDAPVQARRVRILSTQYRAAYVPTPGARIGHLLFVRGTALVAQRFDPESLKLEGDPAPIAGNVTLVASNGFADFTAGADGTLVYGSRSSPTSRLIWKNRTGPDGDVVAEPGQYTALARSPDGHAAAIGGVAGAKGKDIFVLDFARGARMPLTFDEIADDPVWSPDGRTIAYDVAAQGLFLRNADGTGSRRLLLQTTDAVRPVSWCGSWLMYRASANGRDALRVLSPPDDAAPKTYLEAAGILNNARFSPDCRWVAYESNESSVVEVYVQSFPLGRGKWQISNDGGASPRWREDGKEIFFRRPPSLMAVEVATSPDRVVAGAPRGVFDYAGVSDVNVKFETFDNGRRFIVPDPMKRSNPPLTVLLHWQNGLAR
jgi:hypothetical protein